MKILMIFLFSFSPIALAVDTSHIPVYQFGEKRVFMHNLFGNIFVNKSCKNTNCLAYKNARKKHTIPKGLRGGKNPASAICTQVLNSVVVIGKNQKGHQQSFCRFKDKSLLMLNSSIY